MFNFGSSAIKTAVPRMATGRDLPASASLSDVAARPADWAYADMRVDGDANLSQTGKRGARLAVSGTLISADIATYLIAFLVVTWLFPFSAQELVAHRVLALAAACTIAAYAAGGLYPGYRLLGHEHLRRRVTATVQVAVLAVVGTMFLAPGELQLMLGTLGLLGVGLGLQAFTCSLARKFCRKVGLWGETAAVIARGDLLPRLLTHFTDHWQYGIRPEAFAPDRLPVRAGRTPSIALVACDLGVSELAALNRQFREVILLADTPRFRCVGLQPSEIGGEIGVRLFRRRKSAPSFSLCRLVDLVIAIPAAAVAAPFVAIAAALIYAIDPGPVFFRQAREGFGGRTVHVLKLRTMYRDAEERLQELFRQDPALRAEWLTHFKLRRDPRILPVVGGILRSTSFDELPQLLNVIAGDMSLVGPRPFPVYHMQAMDRSFRCKRCSVMPGLTGLWQISERSNADVEMQQQIDGFYIDNRSTWFDWHILLTTIPAVIMRRGAF